MENKMQVMFIDVTSETEVSVVPYSPEDHDALVQSFAYFSQVTPTRSLVVCANTNFAHLSYLTDAHVPVCEGLQPDVTGFARNGAVTFWHDKPLPQYKRTVLTALSMTDQSQLE